MVANVMTAVMAFYVEYSGWSRLPCRAQYIASENLGRWVKAQTRIPELIADGARLPLSAVVRVWYLCIIVYIFCLPMPNRPSYRTCLVNEISKTGNRS